MLHRCHRLAYVCGVFNPRGGGFKYFRREGETGISLVVGALVVVVCIVAVWILVADLGIKQGEEVWIPEGERTKTVVVAWFFLLLVQQPHPVAVNKRQEIWWERGSHAQ